MFPASDAGLLAEMTTSAPSLHEYERGAIEIVRSRVGFDVAMYKRSGGFGSYTPGLDRRVADECLPRWQRFAEEILPVARAAASQGGVAVDVEVLGRRGLERQEFYQRLMRPHRGTSTALVFLTRRGRIIGTLALGRTGGGFRRRELAYLRALAPTLSVCESSATAAPPRPPPPMGLTAREREVLGYLPLGLTNAQIATALGTKERTVRNQLGAVYDKLGVGSRAEAAAVALELGLLRSGPP